MPREQQITHKSSDDKTEINLDKYTYKKGHETIS